MKTKLLILILGLQCAWVIATSLVHEHALATGTVVLLETRPVDPRDLLRGDYVTLSYQISDVPENLFSPATTNSSPHGSTVYVALKPRGKFHEVSRASTYPIEPAPDEVVLKGRSSGQSWRGTNAIQVNYGLERYYVREGTGNPRGKLTVQAVVPASGQARIKQVFIDGKPYADVMKHN
jgi:uncharacterized membrane-anchored protein